MTSQIISKEKLLYPVLIFVIWLIAYIACTVFWEQRLGWDENSYLTCAKGIAEDFDFSSRTTTVLGTLKYDFPQHNHHYPLYSTYLAIFFKLFGTSLQIAYFSTWLSGLVTCIFIYLTMLLMTENNRFFSFLTAVSFLFLPRVLDYCDSAMMEIPGAALMSIFTFFIFKDISKGKLNPFILGIAGIWLYFFKSLFVGALFGFFLLIIIAYNSKLAGFQIKSKMPFLVSLLSFFGVVWLINFIFTKFIFLPLAPMMNFDRKQEIMEIYADFAGGFFRDPIGNALLNFNGFCFNVLFQYFPRFPVFLPQGTEGIYKFSPAWCEFGLFCLVFFYVLVFLFVTWKKLSPIHRMFILFTIVSIFTFNTIFNLIANSSIGVRCRYNLIYVPLLLVSSGILLWFNKEYFKSFYQDYKKGSIFVLVSFLLIVYIPFTFAANTVADWNKKIYSEIAHNNSEIVRKSIGDSRPEFIYFHVGQHTNWDLYPTRVILMDMSNEQLRKLNQKLPKPIEYLFLQPANQLFKENQELILKGQPIVDNLYTLHAVEPNVQVVVYKLFINKSEVIKINE